MKSLEYKYPVEHLFTGSSLGNRFAFAQLDEVTNVLGLWSATDNQFYLGSWKIEIVADGVPLVPSETAFNPESQTTLLKSDLASAEKQFILPFSVDNCLEYDGSLNAGIVLLRLKNDSREKKAFVVRHSLVFPAVSSDKFTKKPPEDQTKKAVSIKASGRCFEITTQTDSNEARIFWSQQAAHRSASDGRSLSVEYELAVPPNQTREEPFVLSFSSAGVKLAYDTLQQCQKTGDVVEWTREQVNELLSRTEIFTPEPVINRGLQWAKINTARVQHRYRIGEGFTNDPPQDIIVIRDLGWYLLGSDYVTPNFSRGLLALAERFAFHDDGKLTEFIRANEEVPELHDYKLNINDDTPLYVYGLYHHAVTCGDDAFLVHAYPLMKRACDYILTQMKDGLVRCYAEGTNVWGICSWRNIIDDYNLTGAVTEINVECAFALHLLSVVAAKLGHESDAQSYAQASETLKQAINTDLGSERTGMYLLNLGNSGVRHHDITGDLIFPVMFGIAENEMRQRILNRLMEEEFWTPFGTRTVSPKEANYDPDFGYQLVGGVWPNLTAWTAFCVRKENPEKLVEGMLNTYRLSETRKPKDYVNVVPGEFPERLHGETFVSRGMTMSPWMPPTYVWLGVEGLLGVKPTIDGLEITPAIPPAWNWIAVSRLLYKGEEVSGFVYDGTLYLTREVQSGYPTKVGTLIRTSSNNAAVFTLGIAIEGQTLVFVASDEAATGTVTIVEHGGSQSQEVALEAGEAKVLVAFQVAEEEKAVPAK